MTDLESITTTVEVLDILPGEPPRILTGEWLHRNGKRVKLVQQLVLVRDPNVFARFTEQVRKGDTVQVTITTEWREESYDSDLADFDVVLPPASLNEELIMARTRGDNQ